MEQSTARTMTREALDAQIIAQHAKRTGKTPKQNLVRSLFTRSTNHFTQPDSAPVEIPVAKEPGTSDKKTSTREEHRDGRLLYNRTFEEYTNQYGEIVDRLIHIEKFDYTNNTADIIDVDHTNYPPAFKKTKIDLVTKKTLETSAHTGLLVNHIPFIFVEDKSPGRFNKCPITPL